MKTQEGTGIKLISKRISHVIQLTRTLGTIREKPGCDTPTLVARAPLVDTTSHPLGIPTQLLTVLKATRRPGSSWVTTSESYSIIFEMVNMDNDLMLPGIEISCDK